MDWTVITSFIHSLNKHLLSIQRAHTAFFSWAVSKMTIIQSLLWRPLIYVSNIRERHEWDNMIHVIKKNAVTCCEVGAMGMGKVWGDGLMKGVKTRSWRVSRSSAKKDAEKSIWTEGTAWVNTWEWETVGGVLTISPIQQSRGCEVVSHRTGWWKNSRILAVKSLECHCLEPEFYCRLRGQPLKFLKQRRSEWKGSHSGDRSGGD